MKTKDAVLAIAFVAVVVSCGSSIVTGIPFTLTLNPTIIQNVTEQNISITIGNTTQEIFNVCNNGSFVANVTTVHLGNNNLFIDGWTRLGKMLGGDFLIGWANLTKYPGACTAGQYVSTISDTLTCGIPSTFNASYLVDETDPHWAANYTKYNTSWGKDSAFNLSYYLNTNPHHYKNLTYSNSTYNASYVLKGNTSYYPRSNPYNFKNLTYSNSTFNASYRKLSNYTFPRLNVTTGNINMTKGNVTMSQGQRICLIPACTKYITYNGTHVVIQG